jgi:hypothetical protein
MSKTEFEAVTDFADWYTKAHINQRGELSPIGFAQCGLKTRKGFRDFKVEMDVRVQQYYKYEKQAAAEVVSEKADLPNISSGESAGFVRRIARNVVQHTPNVFISNEFDDDSVHGVFARHILKTKIIGDDEYSNDMQQNLVTTARRGFTIGFDCVIPVLMQDASGSWYMQYDNIHYRDVFPEPGAKDIRRAKEVYIRRYLTRGDVHALIKDQVPGWDHTALKTLFGTNPSARERTDHESKKHSTNPNAYEIITWYNSYGDPFLTFDARMGLLLRIEENKHPLKEHPVHFYVPERDDQQPYGKSLLSLTFGRQEFQDLFMNGAYKMFYRNVNPPIIGYGASLNGMLNLSPGKYNEVSNPQARVEPLTVDSQSLMMFNQIAQGNAANMVSMLGAADQQMAAQSTGGMMSQTPQGVEAQQQMVDITTNDYQKAMERFFSKYCSYALTLFFAELRGLRKITPNADTRKAMVDAGFPPEAFLHEARVVHYKDAEGKDKTKTVAADNTGLKDGEAKLDFREMNKLYFVQCVEGSLTELDDEKQMRILKELFVPLSQALPAMAQAGDMEGVRQGTAAMKYITLKTIEMSGSAHANELKAIFEGQDEESIALSERIKLLEDNVGGSKDALDGVNDEQVSVLEQMQKDMTDLRQLLGETIQALAPQGQRGQNDTSVPGRPAPAPSAAPEPQLVGTI